MFKKIKDFFRFLPVKLFGKRINGNMYEYKGRIVLTGKVYEISDTFSPP